MAAVADYYNVTPESFQVRRGGGLRRDIAAWLTRRLTTCTLRELAPRFGLGHPDSVSNLVRRADKAITKSRKLQKEIEAIKTAIAQNRE